MMRLVALTLAATLSAPALAGAVRQVPHGMVVTTDTGDQVRVLAFEDGTLRVTVAQALPEGRPTAMVVAEADGQPTFSHDGEVATLVTSKGSAAVTLSDGRLSVVDRQGAVLLDEYAAARTIAPVSIEGQTWLATRVQFNRGTDEGLYGLGQHQNRQMNYNGEDIELAQHNMAITVPYMVSTKGYGILWDNASITRVGDPEPYRKLALDWRAQYYLGEQQVLDRAESTIDYQYLSDQARWPEEAKAAVVAATTGQNTQGNAIQTQRVVWSGSFTSEQAGTHPHLDGRALSMSMGNRQNQIQALQPSQPEAPLWANVKERHAESVIGIESGPRSRGTVSTPYPANSGYISLIYIWKHDSCTNDPPASCEGLRRAVGNSPSFKKLKLCRNSLIAYGS